VGRRLDGGVEEVDGRGEPGTGRPVAARGKKGEGAAGGRGWPDGWAPPVCERERGGGDAGRVGRKRTGPWGWVGWIG
jgi:hypothetical protein